MIQWHLSLDPLSSNQPQFSPFIPALQRNLCDVLRETLNLPTEHPLTFEQLKPGSSGKIGALRLVIDLGGERLFVELGEMAPEQRAWWTGHGYFLSYGSDARDQDPLSNPRNKKLLTHIKSTFEEIVGKNPDRLAPFFEALEAWRGFHGINDTMYRQLSAHPALGQVANLRLGFRCNQDCWFCWQGRHWPEPPDHFYETWLDELALTGVKSLSITGGEPTIHKALPELVLKATQKHGMFVSIQTNAIRFAKPNYMKTMAEAGLKEVFVSLHAADAEISDRMTRAPRTHQMTVKGIEACLEAGLKVYLNCVVERENYTDLAQHARLIVDRFVRPFPKNPVRKVTYSHPCSYYDSSRWEHTLVGLEELRPILLETAETLHQEKVYVDVVGSCGFPPCLFKDRPNLVQWASPDNFDPKDTSGRVYPEPCQQCAFKPQCLGVRKEYLELYGPEGLTPFEVMPAL
jgi:pyruvate-formate lyase-activating enzyme